MHIDMPIDDKPKLNDGAERPKGPRPTIREVAQFIEAIIAVGLASIAIKLPFPWLKALMSKTKCADGGEKVAAGQIVRAVDRASRRLPWKTVCFQQGLAVHWLLRRRSIPSVLHYGIRIAEKGMSAHVWVTLDGEVLIGGEEASRHAQVASFPDI